VAGGTASVLTGGKFANGAITAAFAHLFNAEGDHQGKPGTQSGPSPNERGIGDNNPPSEEFPWSGMPSLLGRGVVGLIAPLLMSAPPPYTLQDVLINPNLLNGQTLDTARRWLTLTGPENWTQSTLSQGSHAGQGWKFFETAPNGNPAGAYVRFHPGGGHHGPNSYWRVSDGVTKSGIIPGGQ
jgi:hypothetical protein